MRRAVVIALIVAFSRVTAQAALLHVHVYEEHEHPEHQHGLSAHGHDDDHDGDVAEEHAPDSRPHFESCGPASHVVGLAFCPVAPKSISEILAASSHNTVEPAALPSEPVLVAIDARGHGPPPHPHRPLRAPPRQIPA